MAMAEYAWCSHNANAKVYEIAPQNSLRFHPTQKPVQLFDKQLLEYTKEGDIVLDPFSGSATTAIACMETGRHYICVEKDKEYYELSCQRVEDYKKQMTFSFMYAPEQKQLDI